MATCKKSKHLKLVERDPYLQPYEGALQGRYDYAMNKEKEITGGQPLSEWATGYLYFGLHHTPEGWVLREWAPNATEIYMIGTFNDWKEEPKYRMKALKNGNWELKLPAKALHHGDLYKLRIHWEGDRKSVV